MGIYDDVIVHNFFIIFCCSYRAVILRVLALRGRRKLGCGTKSIPPTLCGYPVSSFHLDFFHIQPTVLCTRNDEFSFHQSDAIGCVLGDSDAMELDCLASVDKGVQRSLVSKRAITSRNILRRVFGEVDLPVLRLDHPRMCWFAFLG